MIGAVIVIVVAFVAIPGRVGAFPTGSIPCRRPVPQPLSYCHRDSSATCCSPADDQQILLGVAGLYAWGGGGGGDDDDDADYRPSAACVAWTSRLACSVCDPAVSGPDPIYTALCPATCRGWFQACRRDLFATRRLPRGVLAPCSPLSLICSTAEDVAANDSLAFCTRSGFAVAEADSDRCYRCPDPTRPESDHGGSSRRTTTTTTPPPPRYGPWTLFGMGFAVSLVLAAICLQPGADSALDRMTPDQEALLARRARLVQAWAERDITDIDHDAAAAGHGHDAATRDDDADAGQHEAEPPHEPIPLNT